MPNYLVVDGNSEFIIDEDPKEVANALFMGVPATVVVETDNDERKRIKLRLSAQTSWRVEEWPDD